MYLFNFKLLKNLVKTLIRGPPPPPDNSRISTLPLELLLLLISVRLPLESKFSLSRTCRRAYYSLQRNWLLEARELPRDAYLHCLLYLIYNDPDRAVCSTCHRVFKVDEKDFPGAVQMNRLSRHGCIVDREWQYLETHCYDLKNNYGLIYDHVQLALKYRRLGVRPRYLDALLRPWAPPEDVRKIRPDLYWRYEVKCTETPKIVGGRFLHESIWETRRRDNGPVYGHEIDSTWPEIFCHIYILFHRGLLEPLSPGMRCWQTFVASEMTVRSFRCMVCRVEFRFEIGHSRWALRCWMDLGTEKEPVRHLDKRDMPLDWRDNHIREATKHVTSGPGPIETMFNSGGDGLAKQGLKTDTQVHRWWTTARNARPRS